MPFSCRRIPALLLVLSLLLPALCPAEEAGETAKFAFEVKFLLDSGKVLNGEGELIPDARTLFGIKSSKKYEEIQVLYMETEDRDFENKGWINRIRWRAKKSRLERTYKKRYPIDGTGLEAVAAALANAPEADRLEPAGPYSVQVDWGASKMTLSFSAKIRQENMTDYPGLDLLNTGEASIFLSEGMPDEEAMLPALAGKLRKAQKAGALTFSRIEGTVQMGEGEGAGELELTVEIWPLLNTETQEKEYITELSFKTENADLALAYETAARHRDTIGARIEEKGYLAEGESLKTQMILDAYIRPYPESVGFTLPAALKTIGANAFAGCPVASVLVSNETENIAENSFADAEDLIVIGALNSAADTFANTNGYSFIPE